MDAEYVHDAHDQIFEGCPESGIGAGDILGADEPAIVVYARGNGAVHLSAIIRRLQEIEAEQVNSCLSGIEAATNMEARG